MNNFFTKKCFVGIGISLLTIFSANKLEAQTPVTLTQNVNTNTFQTNAIGCWVYPNYHYNSSYWRLYDLNNYTASFAGHSKFLVQQVDFGVLECESWFANDQKIVVNLYELNGATFTKANLTLKSTDTLTLQYTYQARKLANSGALFDINKKVVAEVLLPDGTANYNIFLMGSNLAGQTAPSYISSTQCGIAEPTPITGLVVGADMHLLLDLKGVAGDPPSQPNNFTTFNSNVCLNSNNVNYTVPPVAGATSYIWTYSGAGATITNNGNSASINFSNLATSGVLEVKAVNAFGTSIARAINITIGPSFTFDILPANPSICVGDTITLTANHNSIASIDWQPPTGLDAINTQSVKASPTQSHTYTATIVDSTGCMGSGTVFLQVKNNPTITFNPSKLIVCGEDSLHIVSSGAASYVWTPNLFIDNNVSGNVNVKPPATMDYLLTATGANGCVTEKIVNVEVRGALTPTITQNGKVLTAPTGYQSYLWYKDGMPVIPTAFFNQFTVKSDGVYTVYVTDKDGCGGFSNEIHIKGLSIEDIFKNSINVYPNPTQSIINVETNRQITLELQTIDGRTIKTENKTKSIDMSKLADGVYMLIVTDLATKAQSFEKVIKSSK